MIRVSQVESERAIMEIDHIEGCFYNGLDEDMVKALEMAKTALSSGTYQDGFRAGQADIGNVETAYHQGLNDAWELARKLTHPNYGGFTLEQREKIFSRLNSDSILMDFTPEEAIKRMKEYNPIIADLEALCEKYGTTYGGIIEVLEDKLD